MLAVVEEVVTGLRAECSSAQTSHTERGPVQGPWMAVVVCAGWNCEAGENVAEAFLVREMQAAATWKDLLWILSAGSCWKLEWARTARALTAPPAVVLQTNKADHEASRANMEQLPSGLERIFVDDAGCREDLQKFGGLVVVDVAMSWSRFSHRADLWRYVRLWQEGGSYVDIKMALLQPWQTTLDALYAEAASSAEAQGLAQALGRQRLDETPRLMKSKAPCLGGQHPRRPQGPSACGGSLFRCAEACSAGASLHAIGAGAERRPGG